MFSVSSLIRVKLVSLVLPAVKVLLDQMWVINLFFFLQTILPLGFFFLERRLNTRNPILTETRRWTFNRLCSSWPYVKGWKKYIKSFNRWNDVLLCHPLKLTESLGSASMFTAKLPGLRVQMWLVNTPKPRVHELLNHRPVYILYCQIV